MTININELRRLAQAATPGPWVAKNVSGAGLEIHMIHPLYPDKEWPAFGTDSAFCKKGLVSYETWTQFPHEVQNVQQSKNAEYIAAANPAAISELLDRLEAAEKERDTLRAKIETAENDAAHQKALAASALRVAEGWERKCGELRAEVIYWKEQKEPGAAGWRALARILQAKIDAMEQQEPIGGMLEVSPHNYELRWYRPVPFGTKLYTLPGAQPAPNFADAYQGAMEEVAIWKKRALEAEDLNRKFVAEINGPTYMGGPAQPAPSVPDGWKLVPIEPTDEMLRAIRAQRSGARKGRGDRADWKAWLAAAPGDKS